MWVSLESVSFDGGHFAPRARMVQSGHDQRRYIHRLRDPP
jgi:hypothetical protein